LNIISENSVYLDSFLQVEYYSAARDSAEGMDRMRWEYL